MTNLPIKLKIALDTGCLNVKQNNRILNKIEKLANQGYIEITTSTVLEREQKEKIIGASWLRKYLNKINKLSKQKEVAKIGKSKIGEAVLGSKDVQQVIDDVIPKNKRNEYDRWILHTAIVHKNDYFVTKNPNDFIKNGKRAKLEVLGIKIREPNDELLKEIELELELNSYKLHP